jgi:hypothetical protein
MSGAETPPSDTSASTASSFLVTRRSIKDSSRLRDCAPRGQATLLDASATWASRLRPSKAGQPQSTRMVSWSSDLPRTKESNRRAREALRLGGRPPSRLAPCPVRRHPAPWLVGLSGPSTGTPVSLGTTRTDDRPGAAYRPQLPPSPPQNQARPRPCGEFEEGARPARHCPPRYPQIGPAELGSHPQG